MLFSRRTKEPLPQRVRRSLWPRAGWARAGRYVAKRVMRISATPHAVAGGLAMGVLCSFTPFIGLHFLLAFALTALIGGNMLAAALGTAVGNPITFPIIWALSYRVGGRLSGEPVGPGPETVDLLRESAFSFGPTLRPMIVGGAALGLPIALVVYVAARVSVAEFQRRRRLRLGLTVAEPV